MLVRRLLAAAGIAGLLVVAPAGAALAVPAPSPEATASPNDAPLPPDNPSTTTDCGLPPNDAGSSDTGTATIEPATPGLDPGVICIASGVNDGGGVPTDSAGGGEAAPTAQLPRTGPAPLLPTLAVGSWLLLVGVLAATAGRRRTRRF